MPAPQMMKLGERIQKFGFVGGAVPQEAGFEVSKAHTRSQLVPLSHAGGSRCKQAPPKDGHGLSLKL